MTQAMCEPPLRSPTIVGSAVDTIVWSSAARNMPHMSAPMISRMRRRSRPGRAPLPSTGRCRRSRLGVADADAIRGFPFCPPRCLVGDGRRDMTQFAVLRQPAGERGEREVDQAVERHRAAGGGPERHARPEHAGRHRGQQARVGIPLEVGAEPLRDRLGQGPLDRGHLRAVGGVQVRVGAGRPHPAEPLHRIAAELRELVCHRPGLGGHDRAEHGHHRLARRLVHDGVAGRLGQLRVGPEQRGFLGREVVEEGPRRDVGRLRDLFHGDVREAALGDQAERDAAELAPGRQLLALAQGDGRLRRARGSLAVSVLLATVIMRSLNVCGVYKFAFSLNITVRATLWRRGVFPARAASTTVWMSAVPAVDCCLAPAVDRPLSRLLRRRRSRCGTTASPGRRSGWRRSLTTRSGWRAPTAWCGC